MIELGTPVIWDEPGMKPIKGIVERVMSDWYAIQWENGYYTRYKKGEKYAYLKQDHQKIREQKINDLLK